MTPPINPSIHLEQKLADFIQRVTSASFKVYGTFFEGTYLYFERYSGLFRIGAAEGYNGAYCSRDYRKEYYLRHKDFLPILEQLAAGNVAAVRSEAIMIDKQYKDDEHYDFESEGYEISRLGILGGDITITELNLDISRLTFIATMSNLGNAPQDQLYIYYSKLRPDQRF